MVRHTVVTITAMAHDCYEKCLVYINNLCDTPAVIHIENDLDRQGFVLRNNEVMKRANTEFVSLISDDVLPETDLLLKLQAHMDANPKLAAVAPRLNNLAGPHWQHALAANQGLYLVPTKPNLEAWGVGYPWLSFCCVMLRKQALDEIGMLDEIFSPGFCEDEDWCARAVHAGWQLGVATDVEVTHIGRATWKALGTDIAALQQRNHRLLREKWEKILAA